MRTKNTILLKTNNELIELVNCNKGSDALHIALIC